MLVQATNIYDVNFLRINITTCILWLLLAGATRKKNHSLNANSNFLDGALSVVYIQEFQVTLWKEIFSFFALHSRAFNKW